MNNHNAILECFQSGFKLEWLPFDDHLVQVYFPVMKGTKYARESCEIYPDYLPELIELSKEKWYTEKLKMLSMLISQYFYMENQEKENQLVQEKLIQTAPP